MHKEKIERSEAILKRKRNTRKGLRMRNEILKFLFTNSEKKFTTAEIVTGTNSSYSKITYHLKNMSDENVVTKYKVRRRVYWQITGLGQQTIKKWLEKNNEI